MKKHRGQFWALGLAALLGLAATEVQAASMSLTVYLDGTAIYNKVGTQTGVTADTSDTGPLNTALAGTGYSFTGLSGSSNNPGTSSSVGGFISDAGNVSFTSGGTGGLLTIVVTEDGFTAPASGLGNSLQSNSTATFTGTTGASNQTYDSTFTDSASPPLTATAPTITFLGNTSNAQSDTTSAPLGTYVVPYTLTSTTNIKLDAAGSSSPGNDVFTGTTSVLGAVPEPASLIMMVTGMPLPLVVMGLLRRRRAAA